MKLNVNEATMKLHADQLLKLNGARGSRIICREGVVWITQEGITRDDLLQSGGSIELVTHGVVLIEALAESTLSLAAGKEATGVRVPRLSVA